MKAGAGGAKVGAVAAVERWRASLLPYADAPLVEVAPESYQATLGCCWLYAIAEEEAEAEKGKRWGE